MKSARDGTKSAPSHDKPQLNRRERSKLDKLERIRKAAGALFKKHGFEATTTQAVADAADIGSGTLFFYAQTKEDLLGIVMSSDLLEIVDGVAHKPSSDAGLPEQAMHLFAPLLKYHARDKDLSRFYVREFHLPRRLSSSNRPGRASPALAILAVLTKQVSTEQEKGLIRRDMKAEDVAMALFSLYMMALSQFLMGRMTMDVTSTYLRGALKGLVEGVQSRQSPARYS
jgi:TetR/AcrR family transcriptional regulator, cholesterol catabolism regulator